MVTATLGFTNEERSQRGVALLNHTYKSLYTEDYPSCLMSCLSDSQCKSFNYWWQTSKCDLNNRTKYSAEAKFFSRDMLSTHMSLMREPGNLSVKNLEVDFLSYFTVFLISFLLDITRTSHRSCRHVHPSNGGGEYLIDPTLSGNLFNVYCDMTTDGGKSQEKYKNSMGLEHYGDLNSTLSRFTRK